MMEGQPLTDDVPQIKTDTNTSNSSKKRKQVKPFHNIHTHSNPLNDNRFTGTPYTPEEYDWRKLYPEIPSVGQKEGPRVEFADVGCGFGGLLVGLSPTFPKSLILGLEIREKAVEYVSDRIINLRESNPGQYQNINVLRTNCMKYLPNYFQKGQLKKIFFLFPDPHWKKSNHRRRIISTELLAEYAYVLAEGAIAYTITDVEELHKWMVQHFTSHPLFERIPDEELKEDPAVPLVQGATEEGKKVARAKQPSYLAVFRRVGFKKN
eukprot:TRINITY_DN6874_c0_g1_i1.p1 TRINITY_DN6874_c0_g1~~TRINITY_DN6874_c0_g1_i1.p1  ORF type:complete len:265 (+),score=54.31 TRINITY_DN6874_c0_g1_i1:67-861(+)